MAAINNSSLAFHARTQGQLGRLRNEAEGLQNQLATGQRLSRSSDDPVAASRLRTLERADRLAGIDTANARRAADDLGLAASALEAMAADVIRARELVLWAASDTLGDAERASLGEELEQLRLRLLDAANARDTSGNALFGGEISGPAYTMDGAGSVTYAGSANSGELPLGQGQSVRRGLTGPEVLNFSTGGQATDLFAFLADLSAVLKASADPADAARAALPGLDDALDSITRGQTVAGARLAWIDIVQQRQTDQAQTRAQQAADTGGVDFSRAIAEMQQILTVLEASQAGYARMARLSLFDHL